MLPDQLEPQLYQSPEVLAFSRRRETEWEMRWLYSVDDDKDKASRSAVRAFEAWAVSSEQ